MENTIIKVEHVSKEYRLGAIGGTTLRDDLQRLGAKLRKKDDPTRKIGTASATGNQRFLALDDISFEVKKGEALGIIGHNGAGKSTLLKLLSRVTAPTKGTISYNGRVASMLEVGTGFHPELTGRENVYMNGAILGMTKSEIDRKFDQIVEFAEMERFIDTPVKRYSSGMYVKLAFAVAAHLDSEILIMDEVLAVGDMKFQQKCLGKMGDAANSEGRTVLYVSHNMSTIRQLCTRCLVLDHGKIVYDGDVETAIGIYLDRGAYLSGVDFDLTDQRMAHLPADIIAKMTHLTLLDTDLPVYKSGTPIRFRMRVRANKKVNDLRFRFEVRYIDDTSVGVSLCPSLGSMDAGEEKEFTMSFDSQSLTRGQYKVCSVLYAVNEFGAYEDYDAVWPFFIFEIMDDTTLNWNKNAWGHIQFPALEVDGI
jgi:ABC-type polysaccharide/polyol phosphate transport system ATPase subunit